MLNSHRTLALVAVASVAFMTGPSHATADLSTGPPSTSEPNSPPDGFSDPTASLPVTGTSSSVLVVAGVIVALGAGVMVTALGTAATEGMRRAARPGPRNRRR